MKFCTLQILCVIAIALLSPSCRRVETQNTAVFAGIPPVAWLAQQIAGDTVAVATLLPPGQNPHTYEPSAKQARTLASAKLFITAGLPLEKKLTAPTSAAILPLAPACDHAGEHGHAHDPHFWLSVRRVISAVPQITRTLVQLYPQHAAGFTSRADALASQLHALDAELTELFAPHAGKSFYVYHPAWAYFAEDYRLNQIAVEQDGKEPSARQLARLLADVKKNSATVIFADPFSNHAAVQAFAREAGLRVEPLNPMPDDLLQGLRDAAHKIAGALQ